MTKFGFTLLNGEFEFAKNAKASYAKDNLL